MDLETTTLLQAAERMTPAPMLGTELLVGDKIEMLEGKAVDQDFYESTKQLSPIVARKIGGQVVSHTPWLNYNFTTPNCAPQFPMDEEFLLKRAPGEAVVNGLSAADRLDYWKAKRIAEAKAMKTRRVEAMTMELLSTGKMTLIGEGYEDEIDLGHTLNEVLGAQVMWSAAGGDPLADLARWQLSCLNNGGVAPNICIMGTTAAGAFLSNAKVQAAMDTRNYDLGRINPRQMPEGARYLGYISALDIEVYVHGAQYEAANSVMTPYIAADRVTLFPSADRNSARLVYGIIWDASTEEFIMTDLYPRSVVDTKSNTKFLECISRPLVIFVEINAWYWADVV